MAASRALRVRMVIASRGFEVLQEVEDALGGEVFDVQRGGRPMHRRGQEAQEELEGIAIRGDGCADWHFARLGDAA